MRQHEHEINVQQWGCEVLGLLAYENRKSQHKIADGNGIEIILRAMRHMTSLQRFKGGDAILWDNWPSTIPGSRGVIAEESGMDVVLQAMQHMSSMQSYKSGPSLLWLIQLTDNNQENQWYIADEDGINLILRAMQLHKQHTNVQQQGCKALGQLSYKDPENQRMIIDATSYATT